VAHAVVDGLEAVDVERQDRDGGATALRAPQGLIDPVEEQRAVGKLGQRVVERR
jgi:hypothetical protein